MLVCTYEFKVVIISWYSEQHYGKAVNKAFDELYYNMFFKKGQRILDIGCSVGNFIAQDSKNIIGIDIDKEQLKICKKRGLNCIYNNVEEGLPFGDNFFNAINCRHVIEHLKEPLKLLKEIRRILRKSGKLVIMMPDLKRTKEHFWHDYTHKHPFIKESLVKIAYDAGFRNYSVYRFPEGVFGMQKLYKLGLEPLLIKKIEKFYGWLFREDALILEAFK